MLCVSFFRSLDICFRLRWTKRESLRQTGNLENVGQNVFHPRVGPRFEIGLQAGFKGKPKEDERETEGEAKSKGIQRESKGNQERTTHKPAINCK